MTPQSPNYGNKKIRSHNSKAEEENLAAKTAIRTQHREMENWYPGPLKRGFGREGSGFRVWVG